MTKVCRKCGNEKDLDQFYKRSGRGPDAVRSHCKQCEIDYASTRSKATYKPHPRTPMEFPWDRVSKSENCWLWVSRVNPHGYGRLKYRGSNWLAHRLIWTLTNGEIPKGMFVCHHCDTPSCVNPDHLFLGTVVDNNNDRHQKGRTVHGEDHGSSKFTADQVQEIRERYAAGGTSIRRLAQENGVWFRAIHQIVRHETWKSV